MKDRVLGPLAQAAGPIVPAGVITASALVVGVAAALLASRGAYGAALACWLLNRILDGLDGAVARVRGSASDRGGYFDLLADFLVYALLPIGLASGSREPGVFVAAACLLAAFYINTMTWMYISAVLERRGAGARARGEQTTIAMPEAIIGGTETIIFYSAFLLFPQHIRTLLFLMAALTLLGAAQRTLWVARRL